MRFSPPTEITPEPTPEFVLNYDASCLPNVTPPETIIESGNGESLNLLSVPPLEGEFIELESLQQQPALTCTGLPDEPIWCLILKNTDVFTYQEGGKLKSVNRVDDIIYEFEHPILSYMGGISQPSWGVLPNGEYRLAFQCRASVGINLVCFWDSATNTYNYSSGGSTFGEIHISPNGYQIAHASRYGWQLTPSIYVADITDLNNPSSYNILERLSSNWSNSQILYTVSNTIPRQFITSDGITIPDDENLLYPYFYDVREGEILYWRQNGSNNYQLVYRDASGNIALVPSIFSSPFPVMWSPHGAEARFVMMQTGPGLSVCVDLIDMIAGIQTNINCKPTSSFASWQTGIDLRPYFFNCLNPDPYKPDFEAIDLCISELAEYGIIAYPDGLPSEAERPNGMPWLLGTQYQRAWTVTELQQILIGVQKTAKAFYISKLQINTASVDARALNGTSDAEKEFFATIMDAVDSNLNGFYVLRVTNDFEYGPAEAQGCDFEDLARGIDTADEACTSNSYFAIAFYGQFYPANNSANIEYTFVHELGHRFENQSRIGPVPNQPIPGLQEYVRATMEFTGSLNAEPLRDCKQNVVMGYSGRLQRWTRGFRGWGDLALEGAKGVRFQQNADYTYTETTADMFLNWVYRRNTDVYSNLSQDRCAVPAFTTRSWRTLHDQDAWDGFRNITDFNDGFVSITPVYDFDCENPSQYPSCENPRERLSGNARYWWMEQKMQLIFDAHPQWTIQE